MRDHLRSSRKDCLERSHGRGAGRDSMGARQVTRSRASSRLCEDAPSSAVANTP